jgi:uncharacterized protein
MNTWSLLQSNLMSPPVLAFLLGLIAVAIRSDLSLPESLYTGLSMYLLLAIGLRGGHELAGVPFEMVRVPALATLFLGLLLPLLCFTVLRATRRVSTTDAAALAAHYGSVSAVTFAAVLAFLDARGVSHEGYMAALVALLEVPAILVSVLIARLAAPLAAGISVMGVHGGGAVLSGPTRLSPAVDPQPRLTAVLREVLTGRSVVLLLGGLVLGYCSTASNVDKVAPVFMAPFYGVLVFFLLELGLVAGRALRGWSDAASRSAAGLSLGTLAVVGAFAVLMPMVNGAIGVWVARAAGLSVGGAAVFGVMAASASYIAAPAAVRVALPEAKPGLYLTAAIGITFPFNLTVGIPLVYAMATRLYG